MILNIHLILYTNYLLENIIKNIFHKELARPIGRWRIEHNHKQMNNKIDLSNEDHCGPCGQYAKKQIQKKQDQSKPEQSEISGL
jgi:hypothetical protein